MSTNFIFVIVFVIVVFVALLVALVLGIVALMPQKKTCPFCNDVINPGAQRCKCGANVLD